MDWLSLILFVVSIASIPLAVRMARARARSPRAWFWIAFLVGPFAPLVLVVLGRRAGEPATAATVN